MPFGKTSENATDIQVNNQMDHQINQPKVVSQGTNGQVKIIVFWIHYTNTKLSGKVYNAGKRKEREEKDEQQ